MESSKGKFSLLGKVHAADFRFEDKPLLTSAGARELYNSALSKNNGAIKSGYAFTL
jgi:hypothetical protein